MDLTVVNIILFVILMAMFGQTAWSWWRVKSSAKLIDNEKFRSMMRTSQVIDVRDKVEFDANRIMGARSFPLAGFKEAAKSLRKDKPVLLYGKRRQEAGRPAVILKKMGFTDIYILKDGYDGWDGKTKAGLK
ncbi:MAG: rhodanese-like domain-containing protein [Streptococcaceae bacterium]|jgi:rhodanese-related sulfurtransferase|nr:rhodanese-like domain-containing protein [Streptococcaceae bacterium]